MSKPIVGQKISLNIFGKYQFAIVIAVYPLGTIDVETSNGNCYRVTGLFFN